MKPAILSQDGINKLFGFPTPHICLKNKKISSGAIGTTGGFFSALIEVIGGIIMHESEAAKQPGLDVTFEKVQDSVIGGEPPNNSLFTQT